MKAPRMELADIVRQYGSAYLARYGKTTLAQQRRVLKDIALCRTAALGGHVRQCDCCGQHTAQRGDDSFSYLGISASRTGSTHFSLRTS